jgi:hypothetical protein
MWRFSHLRARPPPADVSGMRRPGLLPSWQGEESVQRMWRWSALRARSSPQQVQGMSGQGPVRAQGAAQHLQAMSGQAGGSPCHQGTRIRGCSWRLSSSSQRRSGRRRCRTCRRPAGSGHDSICSWQGPRSSASCRSNLDSLGHSASIRRKQQRRRGQKRRIRCWRRRQSSPSAPATEEKGQGG